MRVGRAARHGRRQAKCVDLQEHKRRLAAAAAKRMARMVGVLDAAILVVYEARFRPADMRVESFVDYQRGKIIRVLETAGSPVYQNGAMPDAGEVTLACALDYLDFRQQVNWRDHAPQLQDWLAGFAGAVPGYEATMPRD